VGEACDGLRMVLALALTVYAFVFSVPLRLTARLVLLAVSPIIALVCNILRLVPTGLAYAYSSESFAIELHDIAGWMMLPVAIAMLFAIIRFMRWLDLPVLTWRFLQA
jgi:exosortase/archaeosortase family protein